MFRIEENDLDGYYIKSIPEQFDSRLEAEKYIKTHKPQGVEWVIWTQYEGDEEELYPPEEPSYDDMCECGCGFRKSCTGVPGTVDIAISF